MTLLFCCLPLSVNAFNLYLDNFNTSYSTAGTRIDSCGLCHFNFNGGGPRTPYGEDFRNNNYTINSIATLDSDGDGFTNDEESAPGVLTFPGLSCSDLINVVNAPADLADYVDPSNPGCIGPGQPPVANANGPYVVVTGEPAVFSSAGSMDPDGSIVSYLWTFGSYGTSTEANPTFTFNLSFNANVTISLMVTDNEGNTNTSLAKVIVLTTPNAPPSANAGPSAAGVAHAAVQFSGAGSTDTESFRLIYNWDFGDGTTGSGVTPAHSYARCGTYTVSLTVTDTVGQVDTATTTATISSTGVDAPVASSGGDANGHYTGEVGLNVQFDGSASMDPDCNIVSYQWDFGDGSTGSGITPQHSYTTAGDYVVTLTVTDNDGLTGTASATVTVIDSGPLDGAALYDTNCAGCHGVGTFSSKIGADAARINAGIVNVPAMNGFATSLSTAQIQAIADYLGSLTAPPPPVGLDGATLYASNCAACHGADTSSTKIGADVTRINNGIASVPAMSGFATSLSAADIQAIADYLASLTPVPPPSGGGSTTGADLYAANCATCHGPGSNSAKAGATVARINNGIASVAAMSGLSSSLTAADIQAVADFLATASTPTGGEGLYLANCGSCHGADGSGGSSGKNVRGESVAGIASAIRSETEMQSLSFLTEDELQQIADFLNGVTTPGGGSGGLTGETLWLNNCASCHGSDASAKAGATVTRINNGINSVAAMGFLSGVLSSADIQALADYLASVAPPTTPYGLYTAYCASCHGADGSGGSTRKDVVNASASEISSAISGERPMRSLSFLNSSEIRLIADFLNGDRTPPPSSGGGSTGGTSNGEALYTTNCSGCHGASTASAKAGADVTRINNGIANVAAMNGFATTLSAAEIQAIADFLTGSATPPTVPAGDGAALYAANCAGCHGNGDASAKTGATVSRINNGIGSVQAMNFLSGTLSAADIQAIADYLATAAPPATPQGMFNTYCASCHGVDAAGGSSGENVQGASTSNIRDAIRAERDMRYLDFLSRDELQTIADYLATLRVSSTTTSESTGRRSSRYSRRRSRD